MKGILIPLAQQGFAIVSEEDEERVRRLSWNAFKANSKNDLCYAINTKWLFQYGVRKKRRTWLHRFVMNAIPDQMIDHVNRNGLDCRRENLRLCTYKLNAVNRLRINKTGFRGVTEREGRFYVSIRISGRTINKYGFASASEAARMYDEMALAEYGEFAVLNFPHQEHAL